MHPSRTLLTPSLQLGTEAFLDHLRSLPWYTGQAVHCQRMPARPARHAEPAAELSPAVLGALRALGAAQLFTHQAQAVDLLLQASIPYKEGFRVLAASCEIKL